MKNNGTNKSKSFTAYWIGIILFYFIAISDIITSLFSKIFDSLDNETSQLLGFLIFLVILFFAVYLVFEYFQLKSNKIFARKHFFKDIETLNKYYRGNQFIGDKWYTVTGLVIMIILSVFLPLLPIIIGDIELKRIINIDILRSLKTGFIITTPFIITLIVRGHILKDCIEFRQFTKDEPIVPEDINNINNNRLLCVQVLPEYHLLFIQKGNKWIIDNNKERTLLNDDRMIIINIQKELFKDINKSFQIQETKVDLTIRGILNFQKFKNNNAELDPQDIGNLLRTITNLESYISENPDIDYELINGIKELINFWLSIPESDFTTSKGGYLKLNKGIEEYDKRLKNIKNLNIDIQNKLQNILDNTIKTKYLNITDFFHIRIVNTVIDEVKRIYDDIKEAKKNFNESMLNRINQEIQNEEKEKERKHQLELKKLEAQENIAITVIREGVLPPDSQKEIIRGVLNSNPQSIKSAVDHKAESIANSIFDVFSSNYERINNDVQIFASLLKVNSISKNIFSTWEESKIESLLSDLFEFIRKKNKQEAINIISEYIRKHFQND